MKHHGRNWINPWLVVNIGIPQTSEVITGDAGSGWNEMWWWR